MMRIFAFLVVWGKKVGRSFALYHRARLTLVPLYTIILLPSHTNQSILERIWRHP